MLAWDGKGRFVLIGLIGLEARGRAWRIVPRLSTHLFMLPWILLTCSAVEAEPRRLSHVGFTELPAASAFDVVALEKMLDPSVSRYAALEPEYCLLRAPSL